MKFLVIDIQGYCCKDFIAKEICVYDNNINNNYLLELPTTYGDITNEMLKEVNYMEKFHHKIGINTGFIPYRAINEILKRDIILNRVDVIYVKGHLKQQFLRDVLGSTNNIPIINLENSSWVAPKFNKILPIECLNHSLATSEDSVICAVENCKILYAWLMSLLPY